MTFNTEILILNIITKKNARYKAKSQHIKRIV